MIFLMKKMPSTETCWTDPGCLELAEYVTELLESVPLIQDTFMSSLCSINMDLAEVVEEDQLASADNLMV